MAKHFLTRDLTAGLSRRGNITLTVALLIASGLPIWLLPADGVFAIFDIAVSMIIVAVALRVEGPKDAQSFRLYRAPTAVR